MSTTIDVIATTISGSISDWSKVERIGPLFAEHGFDDLHLHVVKSHAEARERACELVADDRRLLISAGGSGTFNAVLEGCCDAKVPLGDIRLGFLRKGSSDLLGKVLGMPDEIEAAVPAMSFSATSCRPWTFQKRPHPGILLVMAGQRFLAAFLILQRTDS